MALFDSSQVLVIIHILLLFILPIFVAQDQGRQVNCDSCPHVEVLRGRDGRDGQVGSKGDIGPVGPTGEPGLQGPSGGGAVYTRWGRTTCPSDQGTELLYAGRAAGTDYRKSGGASNYQCMPDDPDYLSYQNGVQGISHVVGVEYFYQSMPSLSAYTWHNAPCAVCFVPTRSVVLTIPAKIQCPTNWTVEYVGYLMADNNVHSGRSMYECVDKDPESVPGLNTSNRPNPVAYFQHVEAVCGGLSCPPYSAEKELTCVVCSH